MNISPNNLFLRVGKWVSEIENSLAHIDTFPLPKLIDFAQKIGRAKYVHSLVNDSGFAKGDSDAQTEMKRRLKVLRDAEDKLTHNISRFAN